MYIKEIRLVSNLFIWQYGKKFKEKYISSEKKKKTLWTFHILKMKDVKIHHRY